MIVTLKRLVNFPTCTVGQLRPFGFYTLELPWADNHKLVSRVPAGTYETVKDQETKRFRVLDVPGRTGILIHSGNDDHDTKGCILVGTVAGQLGCDIAVLHSRYALTQLWNETPDKFLLKVEDPYAAPS